MNKRARASGRRWSPWLVGGLLALLVIPAAGARMAQAPSNTAAPSIGGTARQGSTLTAANGSWSNTPTTYAYQWQRCHSDGTGCGSIVGATNQTYTLASSDVLHTVRVVVTATNADGNGTATSDPSAVVDSTNGPNNTVRPAISGTAAVGDELTVDNGSWTPTPSSVSRQWQVCAADGTACVNVSGATGASYGVRSSDAGNTIRALVSAHTSSGQVATATTSVTAVVTTSGGSTTTVTTAAPKAPTVAFVSLRRVGNRIYARFRLCNSSGGNVVVTERDNKAKALSYARRFAIHLTGCGTYARNWPLLARYRLRGRFEVTLRASNSGGLLSRLVGRTLVFRA
jgi:hypothetical protein